MKRILKVIILSSLLMNQPVLMSTPIQRTYNPNKHVVGCVGAGFFAIFFMALNHIAWCLRNNKIPVVYWDQECPYYQASGYNGKTNAWEYYFAPVSHLSYEPGDAVNRIFFAPDLTSIDLNILLCITQIEIKSHFHEIIKKYIRIRSSIKNKIDEFYNKHLAGKKTIGIHLRGTDKHLEVKQVPVQTIIEEANKYDCDQYFVATDEQGLLNQAISLLKKPVIYYDSARSVTGAPVHLTNDGNKAVLGEQVLIETLLLSKCNKFIHTCSNVSTGVHFFNPAIDYVLLKAN